MPPLKFSDVLSFSSEDPNHPADNLLTAETFRKWRCSQESCGKQAVVTLKLERLSSIHSVDIGNNGAAFVEVLAGREGVDFQVLLVASSFMTPGESRNSSDINRVRMFGPDKLNKKVAEQKWDRIKVICTQPFNKTLQFGLSFITVTAPSEGSSDSTPKGIKLGSFTLKEEEDDPISIGSIFAKRKEKETASPLTGAAAIRAASASAVTSAPTPEAKKTKPVNAPDVGFYQLKKTPSPAPERPKAPQPSTPTALERPKAPQTSTPSSEKERDKERKKDRDRDADRHRDREHDKRSKESDSRGDKDKGKQKKDKNHDRTSTPENYKRKSDSHGNKHTPSSSSASAASSKKKSAPFASLLKGVTFVMSGYQNPQRSQIRDMMLEMGARYKPDWEPSCTHLICAFTNTPKYQQVKGKGKIVTAKWISDCHKNKIRYPWRRYALPKQDDGRESEEEIWAEELLPKEEKPKTSTVAVDSDVEEPQYSDDEDTDDEIERVLAKQKNKESTPDESREQRTGTSNSYTEEPPKKKTKVDTSDEKKFNATSSKLNGIEVKEELNGVDDSIFDDDTDIDEENMENVAKPDTSSLPLPPLGDYFKGKCFFIYGNMSADMRQLLGRYIIAFDGVLEDYMTEKVNFVVTEDEWDDNFDNALSENSSLQFVKSSWIWRCSDKQKLVPFQPFMVVPKE